MWGGGWLGGRGGGGGGGGSGVGTEMTDLISVKSSVVSDDF